MATIKIHQFPCHYQSGIRSMDDRPNKDGPGNRLKTSQRTGPIVRGSGGILQTLDPSQEGTTVHPIGERIPIVSTLIGVDATQGVFDRVAVNPKGEVVKVVADRSRSGRRMADDSEPPTALNRDVKCTHFNVWRDRAIMLTFRLAHETMGPKRRASVQRNLQLCMVRCEMYSRMTTDQRERMRQHMPKP